MPRIENPSRACSKNCRFHVPQCLSRLSFGQGPIGTLTLRSVTSARPASLMESAALSPQKKHLPVAAPIFSKMSTHVLSGESARRVLSSELAMPQSSTCSTKPPGLTCLGGRGQGVNYREDTPGETGETDFMAFA